MRSLLSASLLLTLLSGCASLRCRSSSSSSGRTVEASPVSACTGGSTGLLGGHGLLLGHHLGVVGHRRGVGCTSGCVGVTSGRPSGPAEKERRTDEHQRRRSGNRK